MGNLSTVTIVIIAANVIMSYKGFGDYGFFERYKFKQHKNLFITLITPKNTNNTEQYGIKDFLLSLSNPIFVKIKNSSINRREFLNPIGQPFFVPPLRLERATTGLEVVQFYVYMVSVVSILFTI